MTPTEQVIELDRKHRVVHSGDRWALQRRLPEGGYDLLEAWNGGRRSLLQRLERLGVVPDRAAEQVLARIPETTGFRDRT